MNQAEIIPMGETSTDPIAAGREAWGNIKETEKGRRYEWAKIGAALYEGRQYCESDACDIAGNAPNNRFSKWCDLNGFGDVPNRGHLVQMAKILVMGARPKPNLLEEIAQDSPSHWLRKYKKLYPEQHAELFPPKKKAIPKPKTVEVAEESEAPMSDAAKTIYQRTKKRIQFKKVKSSFANSAAFANQKLGLELDSEELEDEIGAIVSEVMEAVGHLITDESRALAAFEAFKQLSVSSREFVEGVANDG